ncbi:MAG: B12-binding domain-containing radical SAM protein [Flavobacteriaceae bacterium]|nr:B12-binding domain-containing radical SAM protein [Flavobacteriaceae bacterium]
MRKEFQVLLIAISGVRIKDSELLKLGMTLPGFIERSQTIAKLPSLSLLTLASYCPSNWHPTYLEVDMLGEAIVNSISVGKFDLVAISTYTARAYDTYLLADKIRTNGIKVVIGGLHASAIPEEASRHADSVIQGQGELIWPQLLQDYEHGRLKPFYSSFDPRQPAYYLTNSKIPRYDLIDFNHYNRITLQTSRGCPLHCSFCAASRTISNFQLKPIENIRDELHHIFDLWDRPFLELADDNTFVDKSWSKELLKLFRDFPMKWFTETDISVADDPELLELLAESNCAQILVGLESAVPQSLTGIDSHDWKRRQYDHYLEKIERIQSHGISVNGCFILGLDCDDERVFELTRDYINSSSLSEVQITLLTPFPGTQLFKTFKQQNRLLKSKFWDQCTLFDVTYKPAKMNPKALEQGFRYLMKEVYEVRRVKERKIKFKECRKNRIQLLAQGA